MREPRSPRYQGRISSWKDEQGYGFITPKGGGPQVFVHITSFTGRGRRPVSNEIVSYELTVNGKGQPQAGKVAFVSDRSLVQAASQKGGALMFCGPAFLALVSGLVVGGRLPPLVPCLYLGLSAIAFAAYASDKSAARNKRWRTSENTLHLISLAGGWPGALLAQRVLRHKSAKRSFQAVFWLTVAVNCGALGWLASPSGARILRSVAGTP